MAALEISTTNRGNKIYSDRGTGADTDLSVFQPELPDGYYMVGHYGQPDHKDYMTGNVPIIKPLDASAVAKPQAFQALYNDKGSGGSQDVTFFQVVPPQGYVAVGDIINLGYNQPPEYIKEIYRCVRQDLVKQGSFDRSIWTDKGSGASKDGSVWKVQPIDEGITGYFKVNSGYNEPNASLAQCLTSGSK